MTGPAPEEFTTSSQRSGSPPSLGQALAGTLPCINCGYELRGLSVRGRCPECGLAVRATILYCVDPHADAFKPMRRPGLVAWAAFLCPFAALLSALLAWTLRLTDVSGRVFGIHLGAQGLAYAPALALALSAVAAIPLIRPGPEVTRTGYLGAIGACLLFLPLIAASWWLHVEIDGAAPPPYLDSAGNPTRLGLRLVIAALAAGALLGLRPNARRLVTRSLVLRTGRVDRQTIAATAAAMLVAALGDVVRLIATTLPRSQGEFVDMTGMLLVLVGSLLVTLALAGCAVDGWRIRRAILTPSPSLRQLLEAHRGETG